MIREDVRNPTVDASNPTAAANTAELSERLEILEGKLEVAQQSFGTLIRSLDGKNSDFSDTCSVIFSPYEH